MKKRAWFVMTFALITAQQWVDGGAGPGGNSTGGNSTVGGGLLLNNGYSKGVANYGVNTINTGGRNPRTITLLIMVQDFNLKGARILLRSKRWGGEEYPYKVLSGGNSTGGNSTVGSGGSSGLANLGRNGYNRLNRTGGNSTGGNSTGGNSTAPGAPVPQR